MKTITVISNIKRGVHFFSTDHCQDTSGLGKGWVPCSFTIPQMVYPRVSLSDGVVKNKEDVEKIFFYDSKEINNPDVTKQG